MISNYQKRPQQAKQRQLNTCLIENIRRNLFMSLDHKTSFSRSSFEESTASKMSTLTTDTRLAIDAAPSGQKNSPVEAVVVNSIIYSKPSFCRIAVDLEDISHSHKKTPRMKKLANGPSCPNNSFHSKDFASSSMDMTNMHLSFDAAACFGSLSTSSSSSLNVDEDAKVYRMCTTINGSIHHQISDLCDNILAMVKLIDDTNDGRVEDDGDDSFIEFAYGDDDFGEDNGDDDVDDDEDSDTDDDEEEYVDGEDDDFNDDLGDDYDVVDFTYECPIQTEFKLHHFDKKKKVRFNTKPTVHVMHTWDYAYRAARKGEWEMHARDRERFKMRVQRAALMLNSILGREHRAKIYEKRFANLYESDNGNQTTEDCVKNVATTHMIKSKETSNNFESKKPHQIKKRRKKRFCKMGNKHYF